MRRLPKRKGVSLGTMIMLLITASVVAGCVMLFPKLSGDVDIRISPAQIAVVLDESLRNGTFSLSGGQTVDMPSNQPLAKATSAPGTETAYSQPQPVATAVPTQRLSFRLTAGGLLSFSSNLQKSALTDDQYDFEPILQPLSQSVQGELSLATLQNTIVGTEKYNDLNMPVQALAAVQRAGLNTLCMGFPGVLGNGLTGLTATIGALQSANLTPYGVYPSAQARMTPVMVQAGGVNVALLSYQSELSSASKKRTSSEEQEFAIARPTVKSIEEDIKTARESGAQVVIVSLHGQVTAQILGEVEQVLCHKILV
ncbi:MAG: hypothetical protein EOM69_06615 [Clostridia bacterium]|nr:hypothetical protein [Clostridia bacterium]